MYKFIAKCRRSGMLPDSASNLHEDIKSLDIDFIYNVRGPVDLRTRFSRWNILRVDSSRKVFQF